MRKERRLLFLRFIVELVAWVAIFLDSAAVSGLAATPRATITYRAYNSIAASMASRNLKIFGVGYRVPNARQG